MAKIATGVELPLCHSITEYCLVKSCVTVLTISTLDENKTQMLKRPTPKDGQSETKGNVLGLCT